jgi:hypothetical protein
MIRRPSAIVQPVGSDVNSPLNLVSRARDISPDFSFNLPRPMPQRTLCRPFQLELCRGLLTACRRVLGTSMQFITSSWSAAAAGP